MNRVSVRRPAERGWGRCRVGLLPGRCAFLIVLVVSGGLAGCQEGISVGLRNACPTAIEAKADEVPGEPGRDWKTFPAGGSGGVVLASRAMTRAFVFVRVGASSPVTSFEVPLADLVVMPAAAKYGREVLVSGLNCPIA